MTLSPALVKAVILFPLNVLGVIPFMILWFTGGFDSYQLNLVLTVFGGILVLLGFYICWRTVSLFTDHGRGTPSPWAPPKILVTIGIYGYVRNPMMIGVWCVLIGEANLFMSVGIFVWFLLFFTGSIVLVRLWEEADLEKRFEEPYSEYKRAVPRWIPRVQSWTR